MGHQEPPFRSNSLSFRAISRPKQGSHPHFEDPLEKRFSRRLTVVEGRKDPFHRLPQHPSPSSASTRVTRHRNPSRTKRAAPPPARNSSEARGAHSRHYQHDFRHLHAPQNCALPCLLGPSFSSSGGDSAKQLIRFPPRISHLAQEGTGSVTSKVSLTNWEAREVDASFSAR
jgi:hypothetical protein